MPVSALQPKPRSGGQHSPAKVTSRSGALSKSTLRIVSNLEDAARLGPTPGMGSGRSPRSEEEAERKLMEQIRLRSAETGAGVGSTQAGDDGAEGRKEPEKEKEIVVRLLLLGDSGT